MAVHHPREDRSCGHLLHPPTTQTRPACPVEQDRGRAGAGSTRDATQKSRKRTGIVAFRFVPTLGENGGWFCPHGFLLSRLSCHGPADDDDDDDGEDECAGEKGVARMTAAEAVEEESNSCKAGCRSDSGARKV